MSSPRPRQRRRRRRHHQSNLNPAAPDFVSGARSEGTSPTSSPERCTGPRDHPDPASMILDGDDPHCAMSPGIHFVLAWDIEKSGPRTDRHSMLAVGGTVLRVHDDKEMSTIRVFMKMEEGHDFSECCRKEYWYNWKDYPTNEHVLKLIEREGVSPAKGIASFATWLDTQEAQYDKQLAVTTDNPASDATWVSHYFQKYLDRNPMIHPFGDEKRYRRLHHSNAFGRAISLDDGSGGKWIERLQAMGIQTPPSDLHDHDPLNDARWIAKLYTACIRHARNLRQHNPVSPQAFSFGSWRQPQQQQQPQQPVGQQQIVYYHPATEFPRNMTAQDPGPGVPPLPPSPIGSANPFAALTHPTPTRVSTFGFGQDATTAINIAMGE